MARTHLGARGDGWSTWHVTRLRFASAEEVVTVTLRQGNPWCVLQQYFG